MQDSTLLAGQDKESTVKNRLGHDKYFDCVSLEMVYNKDN